MEEQPPTLPRAPSTPDLLDTAKRLRGKTALTVHSVMASTFEDEYLVNYSDAELFDIIKNAPKLFSDKICYVRCLSDKTLAVSCLPKVLEDITKVMEVASRLGIRVPQVHRTVADPPDAYILMERIDGSNLEDAWVSLSWFTTARLSLQLRRFVSILRSQTSPTAGSLVTGECRSFWFEDRFGLPANTTPTDFWSYMEFWASFVSIPRAMQNAASGVKPPLIEWVPPMSGEFVLTHHDLAPRNIIVDRENQLWLIDWEFSGWYPKFFEYASMQNFDVPKSWNWLARLRWHLFTWITVGRNDLEKRLLNVVRSRSVSHPVGRRFEIELNRAPSRFTLNREENQKNYL